MLCRAVILAAAMVSAEPLAASEVRGSAGEAQAIALDLPLMLDGVYLGEVVARIADEDVSVRPEAIAVLLSEAVSEQTLAALTGLPAGPEGFAPLPLFADAGLILAYRPDTLTIDLALTVSSRAIRQIGLRPRSELNPAAAIQPADFSAGMTVIARLAHIHEQPVSGAEWQPFKAEALGFANLGGFDGWNLVWSFDYDGGRETSVRRRDLALIKDSFADATRLTIGDLRTHPLSNFQRSIDLVGLGYRRAYAAIQPFRTLLPRGRNFFTLERSARVRVEVDGITVFDQELGPGGYDLRDFPFVSGSNLATITIDDGAGPPEVAVVSSFVDSELLAEDLSRFDIALGFVANGFAASRRYEDDPALVASYDRGISGQLTLGAYAELSGELAQIGARGALGTPIGLFTGEGAVSRSSDGWGATATIQYRTDFSTGPWDHNVTAQGAWRNDDYASLAGRADRELSIDLRWLVRHRDWSLSVDGGHRETRLETIETVSLGLGLRLFGLNWNASGRYVRRTRRADDLRAAISVSIPFGGRSRLRARLGSEGDARIEYQDFAGYSVGATQYSIQGTRTDEGLYGGSARLRHIANRAELEFDHQTRENANGLFSRSEGTVALGFGYADGVAQFGRPFDSGFIIAQRHPTIADHQATVSEGSFRKAARTDLFGAPFIPLRSGYATYKFDIDVDDLAPGYDLGESRIEVVPGFRGGYRVDIGSAPLASIIARLAGPDGEPVFLATGRLIDEHGEQVARLFSNRSGRVVMEGIGPGTYRIVIDGMEGLAAHLDVAQDESGILRRGDIVLERVQ